MIKKIDILQRKEKKYEVGSIREITITLSYKCNLNCGYCYQKDHRYDEGIVKSEDVLKIKRFIDDYNKQKDYLEELLKRNIINEIQEIRFSIPTKYKDNQITNNDYFSFEEYLLMKEIIRNNNYNGKVVLDTLTGFARLQSIIGRPLNERYYGKTGICRINEKIPMTFGPNGNIYWCICMEPNEGIIGNYYTNKINKDVLNELISRDIFTVKECRECKIRYLCATGCPSKLFVTGEKILTPVCDAYNNEFLVDRLEEFIL